ncbi:hypothetical protein [Actinoplanes sp. DH11]|uniref:hypothetical protein n=1 Tax=Actinoplanes sp. DH11 TaxID=2857011 RepID=UPI001E46E9F0|nr:hypothetical protein [Actinoplanes sp. DH11]
MKESDADVETELSKLRGCPECEYRTLVWRLAKRGPAIVPELQRIRRHGPGRLRGAALEVLVNIAGEAGLHPADLAAAERLVRIKAPSERFLNVSLCWDAWMCVRGGDQRGIMAILGLTPARAATFALANTVVSDSITGPGGLVFVTPQLNGWTVIAGGWCDPQPDEHGEEVRYLLEQLSSHYGEAHAYSLTEYGDESDWLIARAGRTVRRYSETVPAWAIGQPLPIERRHLDALGVTGCPELMHDNKDMEEAFADFSFACTARTVAAEMSIDIVGGVRRSDAAVEGIGMLAWTPGTSATRIAPAAYQI